MCLLEMTVAEKRVKSVTNYIKTIIGSKTFFCSNNLVCFDHTKHLTLGARRTELDNLSVWI
jgi:hypothetical protein